MPTQTVDDQAVATERNLREQRISRAIQNLPDYTQLDSRGFVRDVWASFKVDMRTIWNARKSKQRR